jgi:DNA-binding NarL/FixJ family response regulator
MDGREIRIVIVHRNRLLREGIAFVLSRQDAISVVHVAAELLNFDRELAFHSPDLFVLDFDETGRTGLNHVCQIRHFFSQCKILLIDVPNNEADIMASIECGASGYLPQDASVDNLISNIRAVSGGETLCPPRVAMLAFSRLSQLTSQTKITKANLSQCLTRRELDIVASIEKGLSNKEIAVYLGIEVSTVKNHVHNILDKLQIRNRHSAVRYIKEHGLTAYLR